MEPIDHKAYPILFVDDEAENLDIFSINFRDTFSILTALSGAEGLTLLASKPVALVLSDQRMPDMSGIEFLQEVQRRYPDIVRILVTAYSDLDFAAEETSRALLYSYVLKPWEGKLLRMLLMRGIEQFHLVSTVKRLEGALTAQSLPKDVRAPEILGKIEASLEVVRAYLEELTKKIAALPLSDPGRSELEFWAKAGPLCRNELLRIRSLIAQLSATEDDRSVNRKGDRP